MKIFLKKKNMKRSKISRKTYSLTEYLVISEKGKRIKDNWQILSDAVAITYTSQALRSTRNRCQHTSTKSLNWSRNKYKSETSNGTNIWQKQLNNSSHI